jgi:RNA polymerase sigma-70 factor (ECF subfamily)
MEQPAETDYQVPEPHTALTQWMEAYGNDVWTFIYASVRRRDIADDLTQDVFIHC